MDGDVGRWVLEFLLRSDVPDKIVKKIFMFLPLFNIDSRLKKALLLRSIQSQVSKASLTETLLESLEIIEELDSIDGIAITDAMKQAYCAVAVECTIRYLEASPLNNNSNSLYFDAVNSIWKGRVRVMEEAEEAGEGSELFTAELKQWRDDIEAALWNKKVRERLANTNSRRIALVKVRAYLAETWEFMGPSFLEYAASLSVVKGSHSLRGDKMGDVREEAATGKPDEGCDMGVSDSVLASDPMNVHEERLQGSTNRIECLAASDRLELDNAAICTEKAPEAGGDQDSEQLEKRATVDASRELGGIDSPPKTERGKGISHEQPLENQSRDVDIPEANASGSTMLHQPEKRPSVSWMKGHRPSLKEGNSSAHTYEWDDLINNSAEGTPRKRRKAKRWSSQEEETLRAGVKRFRSGNWKVILNFYSEIFRKTGRTEVDLKDKWRNMTR